MKRLMIFGAIAAATTVFGAEASYWAQVYDATLTMKTGVCKAKKATAATVKYYEAYLGKGNAPVEKGEEMSFRFQATRKISGLFWGCECETIALPAWRRYSPNRGNGQFLGGYAFWDQAADTYFILPNTVFGWGILNRVGADFKSVEGAWVLANNVNPQALYLTGAGFGKASIASQPCRSIISKISGSFAGFRFPGTDDLVGDCPYCGVNDCNVRPFCEACFFWTANSRLTAAYGSWSIKFNKSAANKLKSRGRITQSYTFKKAGNLADVLAGMENFVALLDRFGLDDDDDDEVAYLMSSAEVKAAYLYAVDKGTFNALFADEDGVDYEGSLDAEDDVEEAYLAALGYDIITEEDLEAEEDPFEEDDLKCRCSAENGAEEAMEEGKVKRAFASVIDLINSVVNPEADES